MKRLIAIALLTLGWGVAAQAFTLPGDRLQGNTCTGNTASPACVVTSNVTSGTILVGGIALGSTARTLNSLTTTLGNTCTIYNNPTDTSGRRAALFTCAITTGGAETLNFTLSGATNYYISVDEYQNQATSSPVDLTRLNPENTPGTGTDAMNSTTGTPGQDGSLIWGFCFVASGTPTLTVGTGFTQRTSGTASGVAWKSEDLIQTTAASIETTCTTSVDTQVFTGMIVVKPTGGGGGSPQKSPMLLGVW